MKTKCNNCGQKIEYNQNQRGTLLECPSCKINFIIPKQQSKIYLYVMVAQFILMVLLIKYSWKNSIMEYRKVNQTNYVTMTNLLNITEIIPQEKIIFTTNEIAVGDGGPKYQQLKKEYEDMLSQNLQLKVNVVEIGKKYNDVLVEYTKLKVNYDNLYSITHQGEKQAPPTTRTIIRRR